MGNLLDVEFDEELSFDGTVSDISNKTDRMICAMIRALHAWILLEDLSLWIISLKPI